jgi:hypothetical protein
MSKDLKKLIGKDEPKEAYLPEEKEQAFLIDAYSDFVLCRNLKDEPQPMLNGLTLQEFWKRCNDDYDIITESQEEDDPVVPYVSTVSRDKANTFIANLTLQLLYPSVIAQNSNQEIDSVVSRISRTMLEWAYNNDGRPSSSGHQKAIDYTHKQVIEGTVHILDNIIDNRLESQLVPNDEIYISNFYQNDIQKQPVLFRAQTEIIYEELYRLYGHLPNFKYVVPNTIHEWVKNGGDSLAKEFSGLVVNERCHVIWIWRDIPRNLFKEYNVPKKRKKAKLFNLVINGVLMFKADNLMPYHDGYYPISKGIFERFSDPRYYWGNSMPGKAREDKKWLDGWKTLIRYKAKLAALPPIVTFNGKFVDSDFYLPGGSTAAPVGMKKDDIQIMPGIANGVTSSDVLILDRAERDIDLGNVSPQAQGGGQVKGNPTAREVMIREENMQKIMSSFAMQIAFLVEARTFPILKRLFQFIPKSDMKKLVVPNQNLSNGEMGNMEILFEKLPDMTADEKEAKSFEIRGREMAAKRAGHNKKINYIDPSYLQEIDLYITAVADPRPRPTSSYSQAEARNKFEFYAADPEIFNKRAAARKVVRSFGDDEAEMINEPVVIPVNNQNAGPSPAGTNIKIPVQKTLASKSAKPLPDLNM